MNGAVLILSVYFVLFLFYGSPTKPLPSPSICWTICRLCAPDLAHAASAAPPPRRAVPLQPLASPRSSHEQRAAAPAGTLKRPLLVLLVPTPRVLLEEMEQLHVLRYSQINQRISVECSFCSFGRRQAGEVALLSLGVLCLL